MKFIFNAKMMALNWSDTLFDKCQDTYEMTTKVLDFYTDSRSNEIDMHGMIEYCDSLLLLMQDILDTSANVAEMDIDEVMRFLSDLVTALNIQSVFLETVLTPAINNMHAA